ncbi:MAG TPA: TetR/AcrR family transcriptional regulator [Puia sp.]
MGIAERKLRRREEVRNLILDTAWQMVKKEGWRALSLRKISDAIEYSVPVIYDHFENKEAILLELSRQGFALLTKKLSQAKEKQRNPALQLQGIADAYWNFAFRNKEYYQLMFGLGMPSCDIDKSVPEKNSFRNLVMEPILSMIKANGKKNVDACLKYHTFWSVLHGLVSIKMLGSTNALDTLNKLVLEDAVSGFIRNLEN